MCTFVNIIFITLWPALRFLEEHLLVILYINSPTDWSLPVTISSIYGKHIRLSVGCCLCYHLERILFFCRPSTAKQPSLGVKSSNKGPEVNEQIRTGRIFEGYANLSAVFCQFKKFKLRRTSRRMWSSILHCKWYVHDTWSYAIPVKFVEFPYKVHICF